MVMSRATKPLATMVISLREFKVTFKDGEIVDITADQGDEVMKNLVFNNNGARA